jgi:chromosome segregation ATPase
MAELNTELLFEILRNIQSRISNIEDSVREVRQELISIRGHLTAVQADVNNLYAGQAKIEMRLMRIEKAINLVTEPAERPKCSPIKTVFLPISMACTTNL